MSSSIGFSIHVGKIAILRPFCNETMILFVMNLWKMPVLCVICRISPSFQVWQNLFGHQNGSLPRFIQNQWVTAKALLLGTLAFIDYSVATLYCNHFIVSLAQQKISDPYGWSVWQVPNQFPHWRKFNCMTFLCLSLFPVERWLK